jgi:hypothetical protein
VTRTGAARDARPGSPESLDGNLYGNHCAGNFFRGNHHSADPSTRSMRSPTSATGLTLCR